jgi:hypothetical protein
MTLSTHHPSLNVVAAMGRLEDSWEEATWEVLPSPYFDYNGGEHRKHKAHYQSLASLTTARTKPGSARDRYCAGRGQPSRVRAKGVGGIAGRAEERRAPEPRRRAPRHGALRLTHALKWILWRGAGESPRRGGRGSGTVGWREKPEVGQDLAHDAGLFHGGDQA